MLDKLNGIVVIALLWKDMLNEMKIYIAAFSEKNNRSSDKGRRT